MMFLYSIFVYLYASLIGVVSLFNKKARLWKTGRRGLLNTIAAQLKNETAPIIWIHASSLGEFEQGRPVIEKIKQDFPLYKIVLTFFSPSGYEIRKNYAHADYIFYLPADTPNNAKKFVAYIDPRLVIFIKYEYWFNYLHILNKKSIPVCFISAIFRPSHYFFKFYGSWALKRLKKVDYFFVQNELSKELLYSHGIKNVSVSGDTRFDRVLDIAQHKKHIPFIEDFIKDAHIFIGGSVWPHEQAFFIRFMNTHKDKNIKYILAPHDIHENDLKLIENQANVKSQRFSKIGSVLEADCKLIIVDGVGYLSSLYAYAHIAYIGGGFGKGIHNILEAAVFGMPIVFGPHYYKFQEAHDLVKEGAAISIDSYEIFEKEVLELLNNKKKHKELSEICKNYVVNNAGATENIVKVLFSNILHS